MHLLHARNSWHYRQGFDPTVDFCLWVLQVDGLHVPPFDQHPDGDGSLRALGMTEDSWQTWFWRALDPTQREHDVEQLRQLYLATYLNISHEPDVEHLKQRYQAERLKISIDPPLPPPPAFYHYQASWRGSSAVKNRLIELEEHYKQGAIKRREWSADVERALHREEQKAATRLYDELQPYHHRIPPLNICLAAYERPLDYLVSPATLLITIQEGQPGLQEFRERTLAAVAELAAQPKQRQRQSAYTRREGSAGQFVAYRRHARKLVPPPLPRPEVPRLEDPLKQMVVEKLGAARMLYGIVDLATVHFLREKQRPGWRLYEVTFQEIDGEQHRLISILQQNDDGSWRWNGGGTSSDRHTQWSKMFAPVHDHPLIFLVTQGVTFGDQQYVQIAHGNVIDNGFHVERVRLVNDAGQIREDTVEDGYVFFACKPEEQVQLPMQAELYNRQGQLVWRQKIPDDGLPPWLKFRRQR
jgi:hypothetical protein